MKKIKVPIKVYGNPFYVVGHIIEPGFKTCVIKDVLMEGESIDVEIKKF